MKRLALAVLVIVGCSQDRSPQQVLDADRFEAIYIALLDSARVIQASPTDSLVHPVAQRILEQHGASVDEFRATVAYYNADPDRWKEFFRRVATKIEERGRPKPTG